MKKELSMGQRRALRKLKRNAYRALSRLGRGPTILPMAYMMQSAQIVAYARSHRSAILGYFS